MSNEEWLEWQKLVIREELKDIKPSAKKAEEQFNHTVRESLESVKHHGK